MANSRRKKRTGKTLGSSSSYSIAPAEAAPLILADSFDLAPLLKQAILDENDALVDSEPTDSNNLEEFEEIELPTNSDLNLKDLGDCKPPVNAADVPTASQGWSNNPCPIVTKAQNAHLKRRKKVEFAPQLENFAIPDDRFKLLSSSHRRRKRKRDAEWESSGHERCPNTVKAVVRSSSPVQTKLVTEDLAAAFGGYEAKRAKIRGYKALVSPSKGLGMGFRLVRADPRKRAIALVDKNGFVVGVLCSPPDRDSYPLACQSILSVILEEGRQATFSKDERHHRRGKFPALNFGVIHGNGTTQPINLNNGDHEDMIQCLRSNEDLQRVAKFASAAFQFWGPGVFEYYRKRLTKLFKKRPHLNRIFPGSIYPCAAINFGPSVCTYKHRDVLNCPFGWCAIQPFGNFDHMMGGHEILWEQGIIVEFPSNWTLLVFSATITHSNSPVRKGETRVSFTQFCPGRVLRYIDNGMRTESKYLAEDPDGFANMCKKKETQWKEGLSMLSKYDDIVEEEKGLK